MIYHSTGSVFRNRLLRNHLGKPYTQRATIARIIKKLKHEIRATPFGKGLFVSEAEIKKWNEHW